MACPSLRWAQGPQPSRLAGRAERQAHQIQHLPGRCAGGCQREQDGRDDGEVSPAQGLSHRLHRETLENTPTAVPALHPSGHPGRAVDAGEHRAQTGVSIKMIQGIESGSVNPSYGILFPIVNRLGLTTSNLFNVEPDENEEEINRFLGKFRACSRANQMVLLNMLDFLVEQLLGLQEGNNEDH